MAKLNELKKEYEEWCKRQLDDDIIPFEDWLVEYEKEVDPEDDESEDSDDDEDSPSIGGIGLGDSPIGGGFGGFGGGQSGGGGSTGSW